jgi:integrase
MNSVIEVQKPADVEQSLSGRLAQARRSGGLSGRVVGAFFGVLPDQYLSWESGRRPIPSRTIPLLERWIHTGQVPTANELDARQYVALKPVLSESGLRAQLSSMMATRDELEAALLSPNTKKGYYYDWQVFLSFCRQMKMESLPAAPYTLSMYVAWMLGDRGLKTTTVERRISVVSVMHKRNALASPVTEEVHNLISGARRSRREKPRQVKPLSLDQLRAIAEAAPDTAIGARDKAIVLVGFASALRAASLAVMLLEDVEFCDRGLVLTIPREKQDQEGRGRLIGIPKGKRAKTCPVLALQNWLTYRRLAPGVLFNRLDNRKSSNRLRPLEPERICQIVQESLRLTGVDDPKLYGSHSMRSGFITAAGEAGIGDRQIAAQSGHKDLATLKRYHRHSDVWKGNAAELLDL